MKKVVVGFEVEENGPVGRPLCYVAVFSTHVQRFQHLGQLAETLAPWPVELAPIPDEEGWHRVRDLPWFLEQELNAKIAAIREAAPA